MGTHESRMQLIKAMHIVVCSMNDEEAYARWIYLVPDCATVDDFDDIAHDDDLYGDCCDLFRELVQEYGKSGFYSIGDYKAF